ncbi:cell division control protein 48 homolog C [Ricinus communis]|uniref:Protein cdcH, putative n=1 Tax=Ricinus communis TaxID=3988 RepID=B9S9N8_RICCO|nr:cell division control protein 48 homolog C [Ricinus communis]EEF39669.1 Protein cdcH, putative [Ricinus communis]|eukprot:XP_002522707.1 cell division control protein 48 homolog C [Ricinus communis]
MGAGRRRSGGGGGAGGGSGGAGRNQRMLKNHVHSCKKKFSTADDIVHHLRNQHSNYRRMELRTLTRLVNQILNASSPPPSSPYRRRRNSKVSSSCSEEDDEDEEGIFVNSSKSLRKRKRIEESEEKLLQIENDYPKKIERNQSATSTSSSESESESDSAVSTSEDGIYGERVEPEFDLMRSMLRESYSKEKEKNIEVDDASNTKTTTKIDIVNSGKGELEGESREKGKEKGKVLNSGADVEEGKGGKDGPRFRDLGGMRAVLEELEMEVFLPLYHPHVPRRLGVNPIGGILLHGPPGCGKTKLAHAIANETGVPFYKISATEVVSGVSGASEENIRELFSKAYRTAPSIVFIDEIDAIASKRENLQREMERRIVTQLLTCMDEFHRLVRPSNANSDSESTNQKPGYVLVIGATNRPDAIDPALRRPGRFDREIRLGVPDENARVEILSVLTKKCTLEGSLDLLQIARSTPGFVGADLDALVDKAGNLAMRRILSQRKSELTGECADVEYIEDWWKIPWLPEELEKLAITMADFEQAAKVVQPSSRREGFSTVPNVKWEDVGGLHSIRNEFDLHIVRRIKYPEDYQKFGVNSETGILLYGPPGCGKTLIAKAVANEAGANFIHIKGPELLNKYVGESELAVRTLFTRARTCSPCVLFFDEVDALTTKRGKEGGWVVERLLNQLLIELDGADQRPGVFIIGATNRPEVMDPAVLRPGRFGKLLYVPLPSSDDRGLILKALAKGKPIDPNVDLSTIGKMEACENLSGADLKKLMDEAAMSALVEAKGSSSDESSSTIKATHFEQALTKISPSVSHKQVKYYKVWSESFRSA